MALAWSTHQAAQHLADPAGWLLSTGIPVAFAAQSALVAAVSLRPGPEGRWPGHAADLLAWAPPLLLALGLRLGEVTDPTPWLAAALFGKAGAVLLALHRAAGHGLPDRWVAGTLVAAAFALYLLAIPITRLHVLDGHGAGLAGDEPMYLVPAISLVQDADLFVEDEYSRLAYWPFYPAGLGVGHSVHARDGHLASFHDAGLSLLAAVPLALGGWKAVVMAMTAATAALVGQIHRTARAAGVDAGPALAAAALSGLSLPVAAYSDMVFPEVLVALGVAVVLRHLWAARSGARAWPLAAGLALGALPWLHVRSWPLVAVLAGAAVLTWRRRADRALVLAPLLAGAGGYVALNLAVYGRLELSPAVGGSLLEGIRAVPAPVVAIGWARPWLDGFNGLLLLAPVFVLALAAVPTVARMGWAGRGTIAALALYGGLIGLWDLVSDEGWGPPGRFMVPAVPLLAVGLAVALQAFWRRPAARLGIGALAAWGLACSYFTFADRIGVYTIDRGAGAVGTLAGLVGIPLPAAAPSFGQPGPRSFAVVAAAVAAVAALHLLLSRDARRQPRRASGPRSDLPARTAVLID
jgi:hypothetical protein